MSLARQTLSNSVLADQPIPALLERFDELTQQAQALEQQAGQLIEHWRSRSRTLPFYLARLSGESLTLLRWRRRADTAGCGGRRFELLDDAAALQKLEAADLTAVLDIERQRGAINFAYALCTYERQRLNDLLLNRRRLAEARKLRAG